MALEHKPSPVVVLVVVLVVVFFGKPELEAFNASKAHVGGNWNTPALKDLLGCAHWNKN